MTGLPTPDQMLASAEQELRNANRALSDAADWLRSDWRPVGSALTPEQAQRRRQLQQAITSAKHTINGGLHR